MSEEAREQHSQLALRARRLGIHSAGEALVFMRTDCFVCRSEGLAAHSAVLLRSNGREALATLYHVSSDIIADDEVGLSEVAWSRLRVADGDLLTVQHPDPVESLAQVRRRVFGNRLAAADFDAIIRDIVERRYSDVQLAAFITACSAVPLDTSETVALTRAMVEVGDRLSWASTPILDKHSVGGLPGNRTTPIVVSIVAAHGLTMPKTSSRAITSPAGTADTMETLAPVDLDLAAIRRVVDQEGGCIVWGGAVRLSPADDLLIRIERALDLDPMGQLVASVLSKKIAAGSTHLVIDMPVGPTAKVRSAHAAALLGAQLREVAAAFGLKLEVLIGDGMQPIGRGIGPALEARDVLAVLQCSPQAPADLRHRACALAGLLLELGGVAATGQGRSLAEGTIDDGRAWAKFQRICEAQGGMRKPSLAAQRCPILARTAGQVSTIDNRKIGRLAKLAGAPDAKAAGVEVLIRTGDLVSEAQPLCEVHAETRGELEYALDYAAEHVDIFGIGRP